MAEKIQEQQQPRTPPLRFRIKLNPDKTCAIRAVRGSDNSLGPDNNLDLPEKLVSPDCLPVKKQPKPYPGEPRPEDRNGQFVGSLEAKKQESSEGFLELRLEASKRKLQQQYRSIQDRRKRIKMVDFGEVQVPPPEEAKNCRRGRW